MKQKFQFTMKFQVRKIGIFQSISEAADFLGSMTLEKQPQYSRYKINKDEVNRESFQYIIASLFATAAFGLVLLLAGEWAGITGISVIGGVVTSASIIIIFLSAGYYSEFYELTIYGEQSFDNIAQAILWTKKSQEELILQWKECPDDFRSIMGSSDGYNVVLKKGNAD